MVLWKNVLAVLVAAVLCGPASAAAGPRDHRPAPWTHRPRPEPLTWVKIGAFASYARYDFPRTNEFLQEISSRIEADYSAEMRLGDLETDFGVLSYVQVRVWEDLAFRMGFDYVEDRTTTMEPEGFGPVRADIRAKAAPFVFSYTLVEEFHAGPVLLTAGAGLEQYRFSVKWLFYERGSNPIEKWQWEGRGWGRHVLVEAGGGVGGLQLVGGACYHWGAFEMEPTGSVTTGMEPAPADFEEDVGHTQLYLGVTFAIF